jgi:hypothetical protein
VFYFTGVYDGGVFGAGAEPFSVAAAGFSSGYVASGGDFEAGFEGAFAASLGLFAGGFAAAQGLGAFGTAAAAAVAACVGAAATGNCGQAALSAGFAQYAGSNYGFRNPAADLVWRAVVGGTASRLGGGKFANGAVTGAFGYLFRPRADAQSSGDPVQVACAPVCTGLGLMPPPAAVVQAQNSLAVQLTQALDAVTDFFGYIFKSDSLQLGNNLTAAGYERESFQHAHHIVASGAAVAAPARAILASVGMDINSTFNGMFLDVAYHQSIHTGQYYQNVNLFLSGATTYSDVATRLTLMRAMIDTRTFPF